MTWDEAETQASADTQGKWLRLANSGDSVTVVFLDADGPKRRQLVFDQNRFEDFTPEHEARGLSPRTKYAFRVLNLGTGAVQTIDLPPSFLTAFADVRRKHPVESNAFEISRKGSGKATTYQVHRDHALSESEKAQVAAAEREED